MGLRFTAIAPPVSIAWVFDALERACLADDWAACLVLGAHVEWWCNRPRIVSLCDYGAT